MKAGRSQSAAQRPSRKRERARILLVDDHPLLRDGLTNRINQEPDLFVCAGAEDSAAALQVVQDEKPDLAVVDLGLRSTYGLDLIERLRSVSPDLPALVFSMHDEQVYADRALKAGARGYVMKSEPPQTLINAIRQVLQGQIFLSPLMAAKILGRVTAHRKATQGLGEATHREQEILRGLAQGLTIAEIAKQLSISPRTAGTHRDNVRRKLGLCSNAELLNYAIRFLGGSAAKPPARK